MGVGIADWFASLARGDGGLRFGTIGAGTDQFAFVSTEHNLSAREGLLAMAELLRRRGDGSTSTRLGAQADGITDFLARVAWDPVRTVLVAGVDAAGTKDTRVFTDLFALAAMSPVGLPQGASKSSLLTEAAAQLRGRHSFDLDESVEIDGFGSFDAGGIQNEWSAMLALAHAVTDAANIAAENPGQDSWKWAYFFRQIAAARIDASSGGGSGLAQAAHAHASGFGGFVWDSRAIAPASIAWWVLATLDTQPFVLR
jgi:hypothetical protein